MTKEKIEIPLHVLEDLEEIRAGGKYNMTAGSQVLIEINNHPHMASTLLWLVKQRGDKYTLDHNKYVQALMELGELRGLANQLVAD